MAEKRKIININNENNKIIEQAKILDISNKRITRSNSKINNENNERIVGKSKAKTKSTLLNKNFVKSKSNKKIKKNANDTGGKLEKSPIHNNQGCTEKKLDNVKVEDLLNIFEFETKDNSVKINETFESDSDENNDFEEVQSHVNNNVLEEYNPDVCKEGITIEILHTIKGRKKNPNWLNDMIRQNINRQRRDIFMNAHKASVLTYLARCLHLNKLTRESIFYSLAISMNILPNEKIKNINLDFLKKFLKSFQKIFKFKYESEKSLLLSKKESIIDFFDKKITCYPSVYTITFLIILRAYILNNSSKINTRLCIAFSPIDHKCKDLLTKNSKISKEVMNSKTSKESSNVKKKSSLKRSVFKENTIKQNSIVNSRPKRKSTNKSIYFSDSQYNSTSDDSNDVEFKIKKRKIFKKNIDLEKIKDHNENEHDLDYKFGVEKYEKNGEYYIESLQIELWLECYSNKDLRWICLDPLTEIFDDTQKIKKKFYTSATYILSFDIYDHLKDLTQKYIENYEYYEFKKKRITDDWLNDTYALFRLKTLSKSERQEDKLLKEISLNRSLPKSLSEFKSHELYILENHLLKYEVIYPPNTSPISTFRGYNVYLRDNVKLVHSKEYWKREARSVKKDEEPYKISTARPKWDKSLGDYIRNLQLNLYGYWQTEDYQPGEAINGKIPRNDFGNVDLYKPCMLPKGTVHLKLKGLMRIAKKLDIDCVPAVTDFELKNAITVPVLDGFVVCIEHKDTLIKAWEKEQEIIKEREKDKYYKRVYGNWKRLVRAAQISKKIREKYKESFNLE